MLNLKMKKLGVLGANKRGKNSAGHDLGKDLLKNEVGVNIISGEDDVLLGDGFSVDKTGKVFCRDDLQSIYLFMKILHLTTEMRGPFVEDILKHSPSVIFHDDMLEGLVGKG